MPSLLSSLRKALIFLRPLQSAMVQTRRASLAAGYQGDCLSSISESQTAPTAKPMKDGATFKRHRNLIKRNGNDCIHQGDDAESGASKPRKRQRTITQNEDESSLEVLPTRVDSLWKVGAHVSASGGVENAVLNAARIGANAFALFVKSQRKWTSPALTEDSVASFKARMNEFGYSPSHVLVHGSYLVNLGNPDDERREKSYQCFLDEIRRCEQLGLELYNFHPGSTVGKTTKEHSISLIGECINRVHQEVPSIIVVIENMAGAGNTVGSEFWELRAIIDCVMDKCRVGICLDTCHLYAAGYDISSQAGWDATLAEFDKVVGLGYLRGVHINDARTTLGSKKDRHENIALGPLAFAFRAALTDPRTRNLPLILETPTHGTDMDSDGVWASEIRILYQMADIPSGIGDVGNDEEGDGTARDTVSGSANDEQMKSLMEQMRNVVAAAKWKSDGRPKKRNKSRKRAVDDADEQDSQADKSKGD